MLAIKKLHHVAIICSNYRVSKYFYCHILGCRLIAEYYRKDRDSWKADLALNNHYVIELFSFPDPPQRTTNPEACGLRHLAFTVDDIAQAVEQLTQHGVSCEIIRIDPYTDKKYTFFRDPDNLPLELYES